MVPVFLRSTSPLASASNKTRENEDTKASKSPGEAARGSSKRRSASEPVDQMKRPVQLFLTF